MLTQNLLTQFFFQTQHFSNFNPKDILVHKFLDKRIFQPKNFWTKTFFEPNFSRPNFRQNLVTQAQTRFMFEGFGFSPSPPKFCKHYSLARECLPRDRLDLS